MTTPAPLAITHLTVAYGDKTVLWDITWQAAPGLTAIVGPNGAGKSTLLRAALGLIPSIAGEARFFGRGLAEVRNRVGYLPQRASVDWDFPATALDVVCMSRYPRMRWWGRVPKAERDAALGALEQVGLADLADRQIGRLSGGQQQRVFLARALAQDADLYLMDEPFAGLDAIVRHRLQEHAARLLAGRTVLLVTHEPDEAMRMADEIALMRDGRIVGELSRSEASEEGIIELATTGKKASASLDQPA